jgi:zinc/manganese transport system permease protein
MHIFLANTIQPVWDLLSTISPLFHYTFMQNAFLAGTLVAIIAGVMGYFAVLRHQSFASHSLANVGFAGATGAALFGISPIIGLFIAGIIAACGMQALNLATGERRHNDVAVGAIFTASLALGSLFIYLSPTEFAGSVYTVLFGNVLGINDADVNLIAWSTLALGGCMFFIARPLFFASIDPDVATARGVPVRTLGFAYLVLLAVVVAAAVQIVGVLLVFALLITPAAIAQNMTTRQEIAIILAVALALIFLWAGLTMSYFTPYPVGFFITTFAFGTYLIVRGTRIIPHRLTQRHIETTPETHSRGTAQI